LLSAANFISIIEKRQGIKIACLEEIAWRNGWISKKILMNSSKKYLQSDYGKYINEL
jgi:glucose-1-phosphate thymidylyltransferase